MDATIDNLTASEGQNYTDYEDNTEDSSRVTVTLRQDVVRFETGLDEYGNEPNAVTIDAILEASNPSSLESFETFDGFMNSLDA